MTSEVLLFSLIFYRFQTIKPEKFWPQAHQYQVVMTHTSLSSLMWFTLFTAWPEKLPHMWQGAQGDWMSRIPATGQPPLPTHPSSHCTFPRHTRIAPRCCSRGSVSGNLVAKMRVKLVKTNTAFSFVGRIDLSPSIKIHRIWIINNKVAVTLALADRTGSSCKAQDVFSRLRTSAPVCCTLDFLPVPFALSFFAKYLFRGKLQRVHE